MDSVEGKVLTSPIGKTLEVPQIPVAEFILRSGARYDDNRVCLVHAETKRTVTFEQIRTESRLFAASLEQLLDLMPGQKVAIALPNCLEFSAAVLGVMLCGATVSFVNPGYTISELKHVFNIIKPVVLVCMKDFIPAVPVLGLQLPNLKMVIVDGKGRSNQEFSWEYCLKQANLGGFIKPDFDLKSDVCIITFSSGTTGLPKGVMLTHGNINTALRQHDYSEWVIYGEKDVVLCFLPFYDQYGCILNLTSIALGSVFVFLPKFTLPGMLQAIQDFGVSKLPLVPPIALLLAKHPLVDQYNVKSLTSILCAGAPLSLAVIQLLNEKYNIEVIQAYGMTETTLGVLVTPRGRVKNGSVGIVMPFFEVKVADPDTGRALGPNQEGELWMRGPMIMKGYYGNPSATAAIIDADGWLHSGDIVYYDDDDWFYICGRIKELIKYKGMQVSPSELEAILLSHPEIADAAVIGIAHEEAGEVPKAFVVRKAGSQITEKQVQEFVEGQVSDYKKLRGGVTFLDAIPKSAIGKILRQELHTMSNL